MKIRAEGGARQEGAGAKVAEELAYRETRNVNEIMVYQTGYGGSGYAVCPRCGVTMEREYMNYCSRCGQKLGWKRYKTAKVIYPKESLAASGRK